MRMYHASRMYCVTGASVCKCVASSVSWQSLHAYHIVLILAAQSTISASVRGLCSITLNLVLSVGIFIMRTDY